MPLDPTAASRFGVVPTRTAEVDVARAAYDRDGAVVVPGAGAEPERLTALVTGMFGGSLRRLGDHVPVRASGGGDRPDLEAEGHRAVTPLHTDGFALADGAPDVVVLGCVRPAGDGGGTSFLLDVDPLAAALRGGDVGDRELAGFLVDGVIDQTEEGKLPSIGPIGLRVGDRVAWRRALDVRPTADDPDPARTARLLDAWHALLRSITRDLPRFALGAGDALVLDNTRLFHGRDPYVDRDRLLWRFWAWTGRAVRPDTDYAGSDTTLVRPDE